MPIHKKQKKPATKMDRLLKQSGKVARTYLGPTSGAMEAAKKRKNDRLMKAARDFKLPGKKRSSRKK